MARGAVAGYVVAIASTTTEGMLQQLFAPYLSGAGHALPFIGVLTSFLAVTRLVSRVPVGASYRGDRARTLLLLGLAGLSITTLPFALSGAALLVVPVTLAHGLAFGSVGTVNLAATIDATGGKRAGTVMAWYLAAVSSGYALGAFAGGAMADHFGIPFALLAAGLVPLVGIVAALQLPALGPGPQPASGGGGLRGVFAAATSLDARVWVAFVIVLYVNLLTDSVDSFFPLYGLAVGLPLAASGALKGLKSTAATAVRFGSLALFRWVDHATVNLWGVLALGVAAFLIPAAPGVPALAGLFIVSGLCRGLLRVTSAATVAEMRADGKDVGLASGIYNAGLDIGSIVGPSIGGVVASAVGIGSMYRVIAAGGLVMFFAVALSTAAGRSSLSFRGRARRPAPR